MLKVFAFGNKLFMEKYSQGLIKDCEHYGYEKHFHIIENGENYSYNNWQGINALVDLIKWHSNTQDRIMFTDPESRIHQPIPDKWTNTTKPVVGIKYYNNKPVGYQNDDKYTLWSKICLGPAIFGQNDLPWLEMWLDMMKAASELDQKQVVPTELFFDTVMKYNRVDRIETAIPYTRADHEGSFEFVRGSYVMPETVITHPNIHYLDPDIYPALPSFALQDILDPNLIHNHFQDLDIIQKIDNLMSKEIDDITKWPAGTTTVELSKDDGTKYTELTQTWLANEDWLFHPSTGRIRHKDHPTIKYHPSIERKRELGVKSPAVELYQNNRIQNY